MNFWGFEESLKSKVWFFLAKNCETKKKKTNWKGLKCLSNLLKKKPSFLDQRFKDWWPWLSARYFSCRKKFCKSTTVGFWRPHLCVPTSNQWDPFSLEICQAWWSPLALDQSTYRSHMHFDNMYLYYIYIYIFIIWIYIFMMFYLHLYQVEFHHDVTRPQPL